MELLGLLGPLDLLLEYWLYAPFCLLLGDCLLNKLSLLIGAPTSSGAFEIGFLVLLIFLSRRFAFEFFRSLGLILLFKLFLIFSSEDFLNLVGFSISWIGGLGAFVCRGI